MSNKTFWMLLLSIMMVGLILGAVEPYTRATEVTAAYEWGETVFEIEQVPTRRLWKDSRFVRNWEVGESADVFFGPLALSMGDDGNLYVTDYGVLKLWRISPAGKPLVDFGEGKGQGPGEFQSITGVAVEESGSVWVADVNNGRLVRFGPGGSLERTMKVDPPPYRIVASGPQRIMVMNSHGASSMFTLYDTRGAVLGHSPGLVAEYARNALALDGYVTAVEDDMFAYASIYSGLLAFIDGGGKLIKMLQGVATGELPALLRDAAGGTWIDDEAPAVVAGLGAVDGLVYVLSKSQMNRQGFDTVDVYSPARGYMHSVRLPTACERFAVGRDRLYLASRASVTSWQVLPKE